MKKIILVFTLSFTFTLQAQSQFQQFLTYVNSLSDSALKASAVDSFMVYARTQGIPFIEDSTANFIFRGTTGSISVAGDFNSWNGSNRPLIKLAGTNFWYRSFTFELDARLDYKFVLNSSSWILDPENPHVCNGGFGPNSELSMPEYLQPWEIDYQPGIAHGTVISKTLFSINVNTSYQIRVYLPPGYDSLSSATYPAAYFQDGSEYISLGRAVNVIDNLIDSGKIQPVIGVFVIPNNRNEEYAFSKRNQYRLFFVNELVPYIDSLYNTRKDPKQRVVIGDSYGGNISALISYNHPEVFGLCGLHSAAFQPNNYEAYNLIVNGPIKDIKWSSVWGTYEGLYTTMRSFRDYLSSAYYELDWLERPEGHSWGLWRATVDRMLEYFYPAVTSSLSEEDIIATNDFQLYQNYPNPFNPSTNITWSSSSEGWTTLKVYDALGREVATLVDEFKFAGSHRVYFSTEKKDNEDDLSSGAYFYRLQIGNSVKSGKMMLLK